MYIIDIPPLLSILNMVMPILMHFVKNFFFGLKSECYKPHKEMCKLLKCDVMNDIKLFRQYITANF